MSLGKMNRQGNTRIIIEKKRVPNSTSSLRPHVSSYVPGHCQLKDSELSKRTWFHESVIFVFAIVLIVILLIRQHIKHILKP
jgi:hypothetical protein